MFNFIDIYSFIPASACVGMGPSALLCLGACIAAKMTLYHYMEPVNNFPCFSIYMVQNSGSLNISTLKGSCCIGGVMVGMVVW